MHLSLRFFLSLVFVFALASSCPARTQDLTEAQYLDQTLASCKSDSACQAQVRKLQAKELEKRERNAQDLALKERDPAAYYLKQFGRLLVLALFVSAAAGAYVLIMRKLFKKHQDTSN